MGLKFGSVVFGAERLSLDCLLCIQVMSFELVCTDKSTVITTGLQFASSRLYAAKVHANNAQLARQQYQ